MNYTCGAITVQNTTYFELRVPDLTLEDSGAYACKVKHTTKGFENTDSLNITVLDPSITKPRKKAESTTVTALTGSDGRGGAVSVETKLLSTIAIMLSASLIYI
ncbi:carcinoembryonic antigen-related cell adhesion molecule 2-like isoform X1 [Saccostrea cucullata]|uniref:carcinoembryonic antigen-related cell adhesion molecule 2-like isoform X1 n=1 Tax=Saccostrea cuccullata TaxID=36930 RepID=UPI002ED3CC84